MLYQRTAGLSIEDTCKAIVRRPSSTRVDTASRACPRLIPIRARLHLSPGNPDLQITTAFEKIERSCLWV